MSFAQEEAQRLQHDAVDTEHLLLGLIREIEGDATNILSNLGVDLTMLRSAVELRVERGDRAIPGEIAFTPSVNKALELAVDEARHLNHHTIGMEHLLLGLMREGEGIATGVLQSLGVSLEKARAAAIYMLSSAGNLQKSQVPPRLKQGFELLGDRYRFPGSTGRGSKIMSSTG